MPKPRRRAKPCSECPFRRKSLRGWLGTNDPQHFAILANNEFVIPCHKTMNEYNPPQCAGRAAMWANQLKTPRTEKIVRGTPDPTVFHHISEFVSHHRIVVSRDQLALAALPDKPSEEHHDGY